MNNRETFNWFSAGISGIFAAISYQEVEVILSAVSAGIAILAGLLSLVYTIVKWYKHTRDPESDGGTGITLNEILDGISKIEEERQKIDEIIEDITKEDDEDGN